MTDVKTAPYKCIADAGGIRYRFYCHLSGAHVCTTGPYRADTPEQALALAWDREGKQHFNVCHRCGRWVSDAMFNAEVLECVDCAPYEALPRYCKHCGVKLHTHGKTCPACGKPLFYEGRAGA